MIDHPGQLIALRLTEYYELISQGIVQPGTQIPVTKGSPTQETTGAHEQTVATDGPQQATPISFPASAPVTAASNTQVQAISMSQTQGRLPVYTDAASIDANESSASTHNQHTGKMRALRLEKDQMVPVVPSAADQSPESIPNQLTGKMRALRRENDQIVPMSTAMDQNADDAADYWSTL